MRLLLSSPSSSLLSCDLGSPLVLLCPGLVRGRAMHIPALLAFDLSLLDLWACCQERWEKASPHWIVNRKQGGRGRGSEHYLELYFNATWDLGYSQSSRNFYTELDTHKCLQWRKRTSRFSASCLLPTKELEWEWRSLKKIIPSQPGRTLLIISKYKRTTC